VKRFDKKLANQQFLERAPEDVILEQRERRAEAEAMRQRLEAALARMAS
jgi:valyl-tRNA synthetase